MMTGVYALNGLLKGARAFAFCVQGTDRLCLKGG